MTGVQQLALNFALNLQRINYVDLGLSIWDFGGIEDATPIDCIRLGLGCCYC